MALSASTGLALGNDVYGVALFIAACVNTTVYLFTFLSRSIFHVGGKNVGRDIAHSFPPQTYVPITTALTIASVLMSIWMAIMCDRWQRRAAKAQRRLDHHSSAEPPTEAAEATPLLADAA